MTIKIERGEHGLWYVTSPDVKGLLIAGETMSDALGQIEPTLEAMKSATLPV